MKALSVVGFSLILLTSLCSSKIALAIGRKTYVLPISLTSDWSDLPPAPGASIRGPLKVQIPTVLNLKNISSETQTVKVIVENRSISIGSCSHVASTYVEASGGSEGWTQNTDVPNCWSDNFMFDSYEFTASLDSYETKQLPLGVQCKITKQYGLSACASNTFVPAPASNLQVEARIKATDSFSVTIEVDRDVGAILGSIKTAVYGGGMPMESTILNVPVNAGRPF